jgi:hypothetical protein
VGSSVLASANVRADRRTFKECRLCLLISNVTICERACRKLCCKLMNYFETKKLLCLTNHELI